MLLAALRPVAMGYLLNGIRSICGGPPAKLRPPPVGTAGNEAPSPELKMLFENKGSCHGGRMSLALRLLLLPDVIPNAPGRRTLPRHG